MFGDTLQMLSMEVTLGNMLTVGSILGSWIFFVLTLRNKIDLLTQALGNINARLSAVEGSIRHFEATAIQLAKQEVHHSALVQRVEDLERKADR